MSPLLRGLEDRAPSRRASANRRAICDRSTRPTSWCSRSSAMVTSESPNGYDRYAAVRTPVEEEPNEVCVSFAHREMDRRRVVVLVPGERGCRATSGFTRARSPSRVATNIAQTASADANAPSGARWTDRRRELDGPDRRPVAGASRGGLMASTWRASSPQLRKPYSRARTNCASASGVSGARRCGEPRNGGAKALRGAGVAGASELQEFFGLFAELFQRRTRGQPRGGVGHDDLLSRAARVRTPG